MDVVNVNHGTVRRICFTDAIQQEDVIEPARVKLIGLRKQVSSLDEEFGALAHFVSSHSTVLNKCSLLMTIATTPNRLPLSIFATILHFHSPAFTPASIGPSMPPNLRTSRASVRSMLRSRF